MERAFNEDIVLFADEFTERLIYHYDGHIVTNKDGSVEIHIEEFGMPYFISKHINKNDIKTFV